MSIKIFFLSNKYYYFSKISLIESSKKKSHNQPWTYAKKGKRSYNQRFVIDADVHPPLRSSLVERKCTMKTAMHNAKWNPLWCRFSISSRIPLCSRGPVHRITHSSSDFDGRLSRAIPFIDRERGKRGSRGREITSRRRSNLYPLSLSVARVFYRTCKQIVAREIISFNQISQKKDAEFFETCTHVGCSLNRALLLPFRNATVLNGFHFHSNFLLTVHFVPSCREQLDPCLVVGSIGFILPRG